MRVTASRIVFWISRIVGLLTLAATGWWIWFVFMPVRDVYAEHQTAFLGAIAFVYIVAPALGGISSLAMIASGVFFFRKRERRDLWSLCLSGVSFFSLVAEVTVLLHL